MVWHAFVITCSPFYVTTATPDPKDVVLILDTSGSMTFQTASGQTRINVAKEAAKTVINTLSPNDRVSSSSSSSILHAAEANSTFRNRS